MTSSGLKSPDFFIFSAVIQTPLISCSLVSILSRTTITLAQNSASKRKHDKAKKDIPANHQVQFLMWVNRWIGWFDYDLTHKPWGRMLFCWEPHELFQETRSFLCSFFWLGPSLSKVSAKAISNHSRPSPPFFHCSWVLASTWHLLVFGLTSHRRRSRIRRASWEITWGVKEQCGFCRGVGHLENYIENKTNVHDHKLHILIVPFYFG